MKRRTKPIRSTKTGKRPQSIHVRKTRLPPQELFLSFDPEFIDELNELVKRVEKAAPMSREALTQIVREIVAECFEQNAVLHRHVYEYDPSKELTETEQKILDRVTKGTKS